MRAHANLAETVVHIDSEDVVGRIEYGGQAIARFADPTYRREVALAWVSAWATSADASEHGEIELARDEISSDLDELAAQFDRLKKSGGRQKVPPFRKAETGGTGGVATEPEVRRLKEPPDEFLFGLTLRDRGEAVRSGPQSRKRAVLKSEPPNATPRM